MQPTIQTIPERKLIGISLSMSMAHNRTAELWRSFMPRRKEISNNVTNDLISLQIFPKQYFQNFDPHALFTKWAGAEVHSFKFVPQGFQTLVVQPGDYAVFIHKGSSNDNSAFEYIFNEWIPNSPYRIDDRPHFEILGDRYRNNDPSSEEEIWIPVIKR